MKRSLADFIETLSTGARVWSLKTPPMMTERGEFFFLARVYNTS